ncbi:FAD-dependent monooxygenase [Nocardioides sp. 616]|uniref:FAD-dependent monooxygenase n=1 Tax=Nocardioides sp. 616 TaxID=2268090 RepID=UPI000CE49BE4|nr:FAD-dependent monooxygenase [Nocardioides sp. 616]
MREVTIVGAGPTGLMLAGELALAGIDVALVERRDTGDLVGTRARGFHCRTIEILDQRGIADQFLAEGQTVQALSFGSTPLDAAALPTRHPYTCALEQRHVERILLDWVEKLGVPVRRGVEVVDFASDEDGVEIRFAHGDPLRTSYLVGADGGRSVLRKRAGIDFVGPKATRSQLIAEVQVREETPTGLRLDDVGIHALNVLPGGSAVGVVVTEQQVGPPTDPTLADLSTALTAVYGTDFGAHAPRWISRFTDATRQAVAYRSGRVLLAGDAVHTHPPTGGQGIGLGVQDAVNLGWKLAQVVRGVSPDALLDSYQAERHAATARVLGNVMTQAFLQRGDARTTAMREAFSELLSFEGPRLQLTALLSGLDERHGPDEGHPLLGRRMPDLDLVAPDGPRRFFELLHAARPVLLDLGAGLDVAGWDDRVQHVAAQPVAAQRETWELPVIGAVPAPVAVLVRPDGHVAWVSDGSGTGLREALTTWFGAREERR